MAILNEMEFIKVVDMVDTEIKSYDENIRYSTSESVTKLLFALVEYSYDYKFQLNHGDNSVIVRQSDLTPVVRVKPTRVGELLRLAKRAGLLLIHNIFAWSPFGGKNEYIFNNNDIFGTIREIINSYKNFPQDPRNEIKEAVSEERKVYEQLQIDSTALDIAEKLTIEKCNSKKGVVTYFSKAVKDAVKKVKNILSLNDIESEPIIFVKKEYTKKDNSNWVLENGHNYDYDMLEQGLLGNVKSDNVLEFLKECKEKSIKK